MNVMKVLARIACVAAIALSAVIAISASPASAETMTWKVKSNYKYKVQVAFYSQSRKYEWPGGGDAHNLNDSETHEYAIRCQEDDKICFGGWVTGNAMLAVKGDFRSWPFSAVRGASTHGGYWGLNGHHADIAAGQILTPRRHSTRCPLAPFRLPKLSRVDLTSPTREAASAEKQFA